MISLLALAALAPLTQAETDRLGQALVIQQACVAYISDEGRDYLVQLELGLNNDNLDWLVGFERGVASVTLPKVNYRFCKAKLPQAFKDAELLRKLQ